MSPFWITKKEANLAPELTYWLFDVKKLGATLAQYIPDIALSCLDEYYADMDEDERTLLASTTAASRIRLIQHHQQGKPVVFGRTIIPLHTYTHYQTLFDSLGHKSIGEHFLFRHININRSEFYVRECPFEVVKHKLNLNDDFQAGTLWMRTSIFTFDINHKLLIEEFFVHIPPV